MRLSFAVLATGLLAFAGCAGFRETVNMPAPVREKFSPTYHTHVVKADPRAAYDAAKAALKPMDFRFERGGPAQGKLSAIGNIGVSNDRRARQLSLDVKITPIADGAEIAALFSETTEDDFNKHPGMGTTMPIREDGIYEVYFQHVDRAVAAAAK